MPRPFNTNHHRQSVRHVTPMAAMAIFIPSLLPFSFHTSADLMRSALPHGRPVAETRAETGVIAEETRVPLAERPIVVTYGANEFSLPIPASENQANTHVWAADVPGGIAWLTPPGFPNQSHHPISAYSLWYTASSGLGDSSTPVKTGGGLSSTSANTAKAPVAKAGVAHRRGLWNGSKRIHGYRKLLSPRVIGVTGGYVLISEKESLKLREIVATSLATGKTDDLAAIPSDAAYAFKSGVFAYIASNEDVHVITVATRKRAEIHTHTPILSIAVVPGGIQMEFPDQSRRFVSVSFIPKPQYATKRIPSSFRWVSLGKGDPPVVALPRSWKVREIHGGSSQGLQATNKNDPREHMAFYVNGCAGCYAPNILSSQLVDSPDSPLMSVMAGESFTWLSDHMVQFVVPPTHGSLATYGLTETFLSASGDEEVSVSVPEKLKPVAMMIIDSAIKKSQGTN